MIRSVLMVAAVMLLAACQTTNSKLETIPAQGSSVSGSYAAANGRVTVPLPEGTWVVAGSGFNRAGYNNPIEEVVLVQVKNDEAVGFVEIRTPVVRSGTGFVDSRFCERKDIHHIVRKINVDGGAQDCWGVNHFRMTLTGDVPHYLDQARQYLVNNKIKSPLNAINVSYRFGDKSYFVDASYLFNPEAEGFAPPQIAEWSTSDWHRDRVYMDPDKVAYIDKMKAWGRDWYPKVKAGFEGS